MSLGKPNGVIDQYEISSKRGKTDWEQSIFVDGIKNILIISDTGKKLKSTMAECCEYNTQMSMLIWIAEYTIIIPRIKNFKYIYFISNINNEEHSNSIWQNLCVFVCDNKNASLFKVYCSKVLQNTL